MTELGALPDPPRHLLDLMETLPLRGFKEIETEYSAESFGNVLS